MSAPSWSPRSWALPWALAGLSLLQLSLASPALAPGLVGASLLVWIPFRKAPLRLPGAAYWLSSVPFLAWWVILAAAGKAGPVELVAIPAWYLGLAAVLQVLSGRGNGAWCLWNALVSAMLVGFRPDPAQAAVVAALGLVALAQLRALGALRGASAFRPTWIPTAFVVVLAAGLATRLPSVSGWSHADSWAGGPPRKGFSAALRLGGGFGRDPDPSEDQVALRVWSERPPVYMKGAVFDSYVRGAWSRSAPWTTAPSSRVHLEFEVHCLVSDTLAPPSGWAHSTVATEGRLLVPPEAGCVGAVTDSLERTAAGEWKHPGQGIGRGWMWFPGEIPQSIRPAERFVPHELESSLDGILQEALPPSVRPDSIPAALSRWFQARFRYDLDVPDPGDQDPLLAFFTDRGGFCEHFATAGALLARRAGLPTRVVTGYAWPERLAGAWVFRRSHAHAWVEVFLPGRGWTTWDPTPGSDAPPAPRPAWKRWLDGIGTRATMVWHQVRDGAWRLALEDTTDAVLRSRAWRWGLAGLLVAGLLVAVAWRRRRTRSGSGSTRAWQRRLERAEARLRREGWVRESGETVGAFLARIPPEVVPASRAELEAYQSQRWRDDGGRAGH